MFARKAAIQGTNGDATNGDGWLIGVLVGLESTAPKAKLLEVGRQIAMHVAAAKPQYLWLRKGFQTHLRRPS